MSSPHLPQKIDREALERIIQRAAELQTGEREIGDALTPDEVLALGKDVGIPQRYLQQAMLEEQSKLPAATAQGMLDRVVGPAQVRAQRVVQGEVDSVQQRLMEWMEGNELLQIQREQAGRVTWEPMAGFQAAMRRSAAALGGGRKPFMLAKAGTVGATITQLEPGYCHVALTAEARQTRSAYLAGGMTLLGVGGAGSAALAMMTPFWWFAAVPIVFGVGASAVTLRQYGSVPERLQLGLERALDCLERGDIKPQHRLGPGRETLTGLIANEIRKALRA